MKSRIRQGTTATPTPQVLPSGLYWFLAAAAAILLVAPDSPAPYAVAAVLWILFFAAYTVAPERTLLLYIVLAPTAALIPDSFRLVPGLNFDTLVIPALAGAVMQVRRDADEPQHNVLFAPVVYFVLVMLFSAVFSFLLGRAGEFTAESGWVLFGPFDLFKSLKSIILFPFLGPIAFRLLRTKEQVRSAVYLIVGATAFIAAAGLMNVRSKGYIAAWARAINFWCDQPNLLGGFLALMLVTMTSFVLSGVRGKARLFLLFALVVTGAALVLTFSRGAWLATFAGLGYLGLTRGLRTGVTLAALALVAAFFIPQVALDRMSSVFEKETNAFTTRTELDFPVRVRANQWKDLPRMWSLAPILGHGFKSFQKVALPLEGKRFSAHSSIIALTAEQGLLGLTAYGWILWVFVRSGRWLRRHTDDPFLGSLAAGLIGSAGCLVLLDSSGEMFFNSRGMAYMWILAGAVARLSRITSPATEQPRRAVRGLRWSPGSERAVARPSSA